ncbi:MAG: NADH-quinone oxidoreductase subunit NuoE [Oligoflexia bacterium]|nr:NADH-quinone oxidoreductase subunit NuoE [Oligoflexia bacterium]
MHDLVIKWIRKIGQDQSAAIPLLQELQSHYGYLPSEGMKMIAANTKITPSQLFGVATFYAQFRLKPIGRHLIKMCHGTACHVSGAERLSTSVNNSLKITGEGNDTTYDGSYTIEKVACLGCCSLAPVMTIDDEVHGNLTGPMAHKALKKHADKHQEKIMNDQ